MTMRITSAGGFTNGALDPTPMVGLLKATKDFGELIAQPKPLYHCPVCGNHESHLTSDIAGAEGIWCLRCLLRKLDEHEIPRLEKLK